MNTLLTDPIKVSHFSPNKEQLDCINAALNMETMHIIGNAGTGKKTTIKLITTALDKKGLKGLYLTSSKRSAVEMSKVLGETLKCKTIHSIALEKTPQSLKAKTFNTRNTLKELATHYNLVSETARFSDSFLLEIKHRTINGYHDVISKGAVKSFSALMKMQVILEAVSNFCKSCDSDIELHHFNAPEWIDQKDFERFSQQLIITARRYWNDLISAENKGIKLNASYDVIVKNWALTKPVFDNWNYIVIDHLEDESDLILALLGKLTIPVFLVSDINQALQNDLTLKSRPNVPVLNLGNSMRFGEQIANHGNILLELLGAEQPLVGNKNISSRVYLNHEDDVPVDAIICRSTKGAFVELIRQSELRPNSKIAINANLSEVRAWLKAAKDLNDRKPVFHHELNFFKSWNEVIEYTELNKASNSFSLMVSLVQLYELDFNKLFELVDKAPTDLKSADIVVTTVKNAKGLEWNNVLISDDFDLELMTDKYAGIDNKIPHSSDVYLENWDIVNFPQNHILLYPTQDGAVYSELKTNKGFEKKLKEQKYRITSMTDSELRLLFISLTRAKENLYAKNIADLFVLSKKLENNLD